MPRKSAFKCYFGCFPYKGKVHHFPPPKYLYSEKFDEWKKVLSEIDKEKGDQYIYNNIRICDHHFEHFYKTASGHLTKNAVPTLNLASTSTTSTALQSFEVQLTSCSVEQNKPSDNVETTSGEASTSTASTALQSFEVQLTLCSVQQNKPSDNVETTSGEGSTSKNNVPCEDPPIAIAQKHTSVKKSTETINAVRNTFLKSHAQLKVKLLKLRQKCKNLNQKVRQAAKIAQSKAFLKAVEKLPEPAAIFTSMQLGKASIKPRGRRFTNKEKKLCLTIYKQSQKAYKLLQRLFALPSRRTIQKILSEVTIKPGINSVVIEHLKKAAKKLPQDKKLCTLIFDEVALSPGLYYHKTWDEIIGFEDFGPQKTNKIADHALVFMVKGLKGRYKQPIAFTFCQSATKSAELKKQILDVLKAVQSTGLIVVATVCDQSASNMCAIKSLVDDTKRKYLTEGKEFKSLAFEYNENKIFPVFDPPHLLKGLRNNLLTKDLRFIQDGVVKFAKWKHLQMLLDADPGEDDIRLINKLTH